MKEMKGRGNLNTGCGSSGCRRGGSLALGRRGSGWESRGGREDEGGDSVYLGRIM